MLLFVSSLFFVFYARVNANFKEENGVLVLTDENFSDALEQHENILVMFYAPWCGHCQHFKPNYEEAAINLKENTNVVLAKVDATEHKEVALKYQIKGYPTLKMFRKKQPIDYNDGRDKASVVKWILRRLDPVTKMEKVADVKAFIESENTSVVAFVKSESPIITSILTKMADLDKAPIATSSSPDVLKEYGIETDVKVVLFRKFDEPRVDFEGELTAEALENFLLTETIPLVVDFNSKQDSGVFTSPIKKHLVFFAKTPDSYAKSKKTLEPIAKKFKGKLHFVMIDVSEPDAFRILEFFGLSESEVPNYRVIDMEFDMVKYKPQTDDLSENVIAKFVEDVLSNSLKPYLMSEEIPPESSDPVKILVGKNFNEFVKDKSKAVFAFLHAPWCGHCKQLSPIWDELGKAFQKREDIAIVKMDATGNEAEGLKVHSFPTLKYYGKDTDKVVEYTGERTLEALKKFVESGGKAESKPSEEEEATEGEEAGDKQKDEL